MNINNKGFKDWTVEDLQEIIENEAYKESEYVDYKETFAVIECQDKESKRRKQNGFRHDVCSFANADGGYLVFGIKEEAGIPIEINGIDVSNTDKFELDRRNELAGILPIIPGMEFSFVKVSDGKFVVVLRIFRGVYKPYLYKENEGIYKFYVRRGNRKQEMSYTEIRENFLHSSSFAAEVKNFRKERLIFYRGEHPNTPFALIQVIPIDFLNETEMKILYNEYKEKDIGFHDIFNGLCYEHICPNVDGVCFPDYKFNHGVFLQLYNNGISELYYEIEIRDRNGDEWLYGAGILEKMRKLVEGAKGLFALQKTHLTAYVCVTISGCKGLWSDSDYNTDYLAQVDRNEINCMPIEIHDIADEAMVNEAIEKCEMIISYSLGRKYNKS